MIVTGFKALATEEESSENADALFAQLYVLEKIVINCTTQEIQNLICFFEKVKGSYVSASNYGHMHLRDFDDDWKQGECDVVMSINLDKLCE